MCMKFNDQIDAPKEIPFECPWTFLWLHPQDSDSWPFVEIWEFIVW